MINKESNKIALLGAGCSLVSERIAEVAKTWNLLMVSRRILTRITMTLKGIEVPLTREKKLPIWRLALTLGTTNFWQGTAIINRNTAADL